MRIVAGFAAALAVIAGGACLNTPARAQDAVDQNSASPYGMAINDQRIFIHGLLEQFEGRFGDGYNSLRWDGELWAGTDTNRLWLKSEGELGRGDKVADGEHEVLYDRPITPYFDLQAGLRSDVDSRTGRSWAALGIEGLAPYFFHLSATAYASDIGHYAAKLIGMYELLLTQQLILQPDIEVNFYTKDDPARLTGSGLSDIDTGVRLRYEITRKFAPYIGISYERKFAGSENFARADGERAAAVRLALGVRTWF